MTQSDTRSDERIDLPQLCEPLAVGLGLIESAMVLRVPYGYILPGANAAISVRTVERLEALDLVRPHPQCGRKTMQPTALGLQTLAAHEDRMAPMHCDRQAARHRNSRILHAATPSNIRSVGSASHRAILERLGDITGGLLARWQSTRMRLTCLHAGPSRQLSRLGRWSRRVPSFDHGGGVTDHGGGVTPTRSAGSFRLRELRRETS